MHRNLSISRALIAIYCLGFANLVSAWDGHVTGKISEIHAVGGSAGAPGNHDLRVFIENQPNVCAGATDPTWGYVNSNDPNYKGLMAIILIAQATGKVITVYTTKGPTGYCQIGYLSFPSQ